MKFYVYELVRKSDGKVLYVGKGSGRRMDLHHLFASGGRTAKQRNLYASLRAIVDSGDDFFGRKVFESDDEGEVLQKELEIINEYGLDNLLNGVSAHVFGAINSQKAAQVRQAISKARTGMKFSDEHRKNIQKAISARPPRSEEWRHHQVLGQTGITHKKHSNALPPGLKRQSELAKYRRFYQTHHEQRLADANARNDAFRLQKWQSTLTTKGLSLDTPMPQIIGPLATLTPEQRGERKRARERVNHALRKARADGNDAEIERLEAERHKMDEAIVASLVAELLA